jgi:hypothetical protein
MALFFDFPALPEREVWNGYYLRNLNSPILNFFGKVAIRVSYNKLTNEHHSYIPCFIIPYLSFSLFELKFILESYLKMFSVSSIYQDINELQDSEYFDFPPATLYFLLSYFLRICNQYLGINISSYSISSYRNIPTNFWGKYTQYLQARASPYL